MLERIIKIAGGFFQGAATGAVVGFPLTYALSALLAKWYAQAELGALLIIVVLCALLGGLVGALLVIIPSNTRLRALRYIYIVIGVVFVLGFLQMGAFELVASHIPGFSAGTLPTTKQRIMDANEKMNFTILAPRYLPSGIRKGWSAADGGMQISDADDNKDCHGIRFPYTFKGSILDIGESKAGVSVHECENGPEVYREEVEEVTGDPQVEKVDLNGDALFLLRYKDGDWAGRLEKAILWKENTWVRIIHSDPRLCRESCEQTIVDLAGSMEPIRL